MLGLVNDGTLQATHITLGYLVRSNLLVAVIDEGVFVTVATRVDALELEIVDRQMVLESQLLASVEE